MLRTPDSQGPQGASQFASNFRGTATLIELATRASAASVKIVGLGMIRTPLRGQPLLYANS